MECKLYEKNRFDIGGEPALPPQAATAGTYTSGWFGMENYSSAEFILLGGVANDADAVLNAYVQQATSNAGANAKLLTYGVSGQPVAITAVTAGAGFATRSDLWIMHFRDADLDVNNGFGWVRIGVGISAGDTWYIAAVLHRETRDWDPVPALTTQTIG